MTTKDYPLSLGYIFKQESYLLHRRYFPSKVGGKPAWLDPINLPNGDKVLVCPRPDCCNQPLTFILQVYAGRDSPDDAFHRTIYIFGCQWCSETFVALRCQLPRCNDFYPSVPAETEDPTRYDECLEKRCCPACGIPTDQRVFPQVKEILEPRDIDRLSSLSSVRGVPKIHHRCKVAREWVGMPIPVVFEEWELDIAEENLDPSEVDNTDFSHEQALLERYRIEVKNDPENELDEGEQEAFDEIHRKKFQEDPIFKKFLKRIRLNPGHVLRYYSNDDSDSMPLWFSSHQLPTQQQLDDQVGRCNNCGGHRRLEFQIQPNLINDLWRDCRLSFGILAVYSCEASCSPKLNQNTTNIYEGSHQEETPNMYGSYIAEYVFKQEEKFDPK